MAGCGTHIRITTTFLLRKGKRSYGGVFSVYRSNVTIGMGQITQGDLTLTRITKAIGSESKQEFYSDIKKGMPGSSCMLGNLTKVKTLVLRR